jgi:small subunit ribosomal protein S9
VAQVQYYGTGRRKHSVARVRLVPGDGRVVINARDMDDYFGGLEVLKLIVKQPLNLTEAVGKYDVLVNVRGGGSTGQAGAIRHGISRALLQADPESRGALKRAGVWTSRFKPVGRSHRTRQGQT